MYIWAYGKGSGHGSGRVGSDFLSAIAGRVGSGQRFAGSGRVGSKKSDSWTTLHRPASYRVHGWFNTGRSSTHGCLSSWGRKTIWWTDDALILLRAAVGHPTIMNVLRVAPCADHRLLCSSIRCSVLVWPRLSIVNWTTWHGSRLASPYAMVASVWEVLLCLPRVPFDLGCCYLRAPGRYSGRGCAGRWWVCASR